MSCSLSWDARSRQLSYTGDTSHVSSGGASTVLVSKSCTFHLGHPNSGLTPLRVLWIHLWCVFWIPVRWVGVGRRMHDLANHLRILKSSRCTTELFWMGSDKTKRIYRCEQLSSNPCESQGTGDWSRKRSQNSLRDRQRLR